MLHALLCLLPAVAVAIPLLARRYPGERVLLALRSAEPTRWPRPRACAPAHRRVALAAVRGGRLMGSFLAVRPPPALISAS
ncbi:MAG TPA: hypothetical protein VNY31_02905 [Solirubrobacteraceae bacterium]|nr:hypothetical protein [Solirubrobacteraceae bacterium]